MPYKVSVVVPVYNNEEFMNQCFEQLIHQSLKDIQLIFVNDGSTDNTAKILDKCAEDISNVIVIHQENRGVAAARNRGIKEATGEYIGFVDADDEVDEDMYEMLYNKAKEYSLDIICMERGDTSRGLFLYEKKEDWLSDLFLARIKMSACNKLFKRELLGKGTFPEGKRIHEDLFVVYHAMKKAEAVGSLPFSKYHYIHREGSSSTAAVFSDKYFDAIDIADEVYQDAVNNFPMLTDLAEARRAKTYIRMSKIYFLRKAPKQYRDRIDSMRKYLKSLDKRKLKLYYNRNDRIRYYLYLYARPLFFCLIHTIDNK